jgi:hypothetical protein
VQRIKSIMARKIFKAYPEVKKIIMGRGILDAWILYRNSWGTWGLRNDSKICNEPVTQTGRI